MKPLVDLCRVNTVSKDDSFVGLDFENGIPRITFPIGFDVDKKNEIDLRNDICLILSCIQNNNCSKLIDEKADVNNKLTSTAKFPFLAYKFIIEDYLRNGLYICKEKEYKRDSKGNIDWKKTIKKTIPYIQEDSFVFNTFIVKKVNVNEQALLTNIHKYCIYESCRQLGWLYNGISFPKPKMMINKHQFIAILTKVRRETFTDTTKMLFTNMLSVINGLDEHTQFEQTLKVGTNRFEYLWEYMLNKKFGIANKQDYFPKATWYLSNGNKTQSPLELDTIFFEGDTAYIVDAKYYKYGQTRVKEDLPGTSTIAKQVIYGTYVGKVGKYKNNRITNVVNAFVMPYKTSCLTPLEYLGFAKVDWLDDEDKYNKINLIVYDTKKLMQSYLVNNDKDTRELIKCMKNANG